MPDTCWCAGILSTSRRCGCVQKLEYGTFAPCGGHGSPRFIAAGASNENKDSNGFKRINLEFNQIASKQAHMRKTVVIVHEQKGGMVFTGNNHEIGIQHIHDSWTYINGNWTYHFNNPTVDHYVLTNNNIANLYINNTQYIQYSPYTVDTDSIKTHYFSGDKLITIAVLVAERNSVLFVGGYELDGGLARQKGWTGKNYLYELITYDKFLTETECNNLTEYLNKKWEVYETATGEYSPNASTTNPVSTNIKSHIDASTLFIRDYIDLSNDSSVLTKKITFTPTTLTNDLYYYCHNH